MAVFKLTANGSTAFGSNRYTAIPLRKKLEDMLRQHKSVVIDFSGIDQATQSWVDEFIGRLVLVGGQSFLDKVQLKNCNADIQATIRFVVSDRLRDYAKATPSYNRVSQSYPSMGYC